MRLSRKGLAAAKRIAEKNNVDVKKVIAAYQMAAKPKAQWNSALLFLGK